MKTIKRNVTIINRTRSKAEALAEHMNVRVADMADLSAEIDLADIVIVATGAQTPTLSSAHVTDCMEIEKKLLLDLSVPRNIDPELDKLPCIDQIDMDKLNSIQDDTLSMRRKNIPKPVRLSTCIKPSFTTG